MQVHEENNAGGGKKKEKTLASCSLTWASFFFLSFYLDNEKVDKLTKMDHAAKKHGN